MRGRINQETLAEKLGTSQPGLSHWLNNRSQPSLDDINRIADEIGVSRVWLTHGLGPGDGPGKILIDLLLSGALTESDMSPLAATAQALFRARQPATLPEDSHARRMANHLAVDDSAVTPEAVDTVFAQIEKEALGQRTKSTKKLLKERKAG